jgi:ATP/maltotriose-dependent transcriptional regulator MalT
MTQEQQYQDFPLRLPLSIFERANEMAHREGLSLNQLIALAVAEKISRLDQGEIWASNKQLSRLVSPLSAPKPADETSSHKRPLTPRERQVLQLLTDGRSNDELATALNVSKGTIKNHLFSIYDKLGVANRMEAILSVLAPNDAQPARSVGETRSSEVRTARAE